MVVVVVVVVLVLVLLVLLVVVDGGAVSGGGGKKKKKKKERRENFGSGLWAQGYSLRLVPGTDLASKEIPWISPVLNQTGRHG